MTTISAPTIPDQLIATVRVVGQGTVEQKADFYNAMLEQGSDDVRIRWIVEQVLGEQSDIAWTALRAFAAERRKRTLYADIYNVIPAGRTAALLFPNTVEGKFYNSIPEVIRKIAQAIDTQIKAAAGKPVYDVSGAELFGGSKEKLEQLLTDAIGKFSFNQVKEIGFQNLARFIQKMPIFPLPDVGELVDFSDTQKAANVQARKLPNGYYSFPAATAYALMGWCFTDKGKRVYLDQLPNPPKIFYDLEFGICFAEDVAYWMTADPPVGLFGLDAATKLMPQISKLISPNSSGGAWAYFGPTEMLRRIAQRWFDTTGVSDLNNLEFRKENIPVSYNFESYFDEVAGLQINKILTEDGWVFLDQGQLTNGEIKNLGTERRYSDYGYVWVNFGVFNTFETQEGIYNKETNRFIVTSEKRIGFSTLLGSGRPYIDLGGWGEGEGITYAAAYWYPGATALLFQTTGEATGLKAFLSSDLFKIVSVALAIYGIGAALASISSAGVGFANVAQLTASVNALPGVDLGVVGDVASLISAGVNISKSIPTGGYDMPDIEFEFGSFDTGGFDVTGLDTGGFDATGLDFGGFYSSDLDFGGLNFDSVIDPGALDIDLTLSDIGANVYDFAYIEETVSDLGLQPTDLFIDELGNAFTITGEAAVVTPETYVKTIYIDSAGNYRDYTNTVVLEQAEADIVYAQSGGSDEAVAERLAEKVQARSGREFVSQQGDVARPAAAPAPSSQGKLPSFSELSKEVMGWFKTVTSYSLAREQLEKTGRYTPPYQTSPTGTAYSQVPGVPIRRNDGSIVTNNGNGTQTIQYPDGRVQTVPTNLNPNSFSGGALIPGISNQTLLIAGAGLLAVVLLARRK